jgi:hypothetical protein
MIPLRQFTSESIWRGAPFRLTPESTQATELICGWRYFVLRSMRVLKMRP